MRLIIDMQGAQSSGSRNRGIGRYTTSLTKALLQLRGEDEVFLVLNGAFSDTIELIRAEIAELIPTRNIQIWFPPKPCRSAEFENNSRRNAAELVREAFIASLRPDIVLVTSLFEGLSDDAVTSVGRLTTTLPTAVVLYDLIPLIHRDIYLTNPVVEDWYLNKLDQLRRADLLLSISASSGREGIEWLGFHDEQVINISTACDAHFHPIQISETERLALLTRYGLQRPFVMYTGGIDHRKNIEGLIRAYAALSMELRATHQLAVVCSVQPADRERLMHLAKSHNLVDNELVMTGFVPEDDLVGLYNTCKLFVFPSWHEGFGLPALEAMACGRAVIGANTSSVPEVIGRSDALFDPRNDQAITHKMAQVLNNDSYRSELEAHGVQQAASFSWLRSAQTAWEALRRMPLRPLNVVSTAKRPRLAYLSPVPSGKSGIADYSAELLPELARHYQIDVVVFQEEQVTDNWLLANCQVRTVEWFRSHAEDFDRVLYHFGNSHFHGHMFDLLHDVPGVIVLHDFFLSGILAHMDVHEQDPGCWSRALLSSHGWPAVHMRHTVKDTADAIWAYPCNLSVLQMATGVIVHSENSIRLAEHWYGSAAAKDWSLVPHMRVPAFAVDKSAARTALGLADDDFVVCSFGLLGRTKLNHRLLQAWLASPMAAHRQCRLVFVGQNEGGDYGKLLVTTIESSGATAVITGWVDTFGYRQWLAAANVAVQLRTHSRGETSGTVLDCMNFGLATIVNAHGSMADLPNDVVYKLDDEFTDAQLAEAMAVLWQNEQQRKDLGQRGRACILTAHQPRHCADLYHQAIEGFHNSAISGPLGVANAIQASNHILEETTILQIAQSLAATFPPSPRRPQLLIDISELVKHDAKSGIQRVVKSLLLPLLLKSQHGWQVEAVYASSSEHSYRYARQFTCGHLGIPSNWAHDDLVEVWADDAFVALDLQPTVIAAQMPLLQQWQKRGVKLHAVLYDLLPILIPHAFEADAARGHHLWLNRIACFDQVVSISRAVADEFAEWLHVYGPHQRRLPLQLHYFHLGANFESTAPCMDYSTHESAALACTSIAPSFLVVGTIEPRKGHLLVLDAFNLLWAQGTDVNLIIVGRQGWAVETLIEKLRRHPQAGQRLHWLEDANDKCLSSLYEQSACLIAASEGEGFGLPLVEAAKHALPILARDIPVFREVAAEHAAYFPAEANATDLMHTISQWLQLYRAQAHPRSDSLPWVSWDEAAQKFLAIAQGDALAYKSWRPDNVMRFYGNDFRLLTQVGRRDGQFMHSTNQSGFLIYGPYLPLKAAYYTVLLLGTCRHWAGTETFDISCNGGNVTLLHIDLSAEISGNWSKKLEFRLPNDVSDFELRLFVTDHTDISLRGIELFAKV